MTQGSAAVVRVAQVKSIVTAGAALTAPASLTGSTPSPIARVGSVRGWATQASYVWNGTQWVANTCAAFLTAPAGLGGSSNLIVPNPAAPLSAPAWLSGTAQVTIPNPAAALVAVAVLGGSATQSIPGGSGSTSVTVQAPPLVVSINVPVPVINAANFTYEPPTWRNVGQLRGSLLYGVQTSYCVYRKSGQWFVDQSPGIGVLDGADYVFTGPSPIPAELVPELLAFGIGTIISS